MKRIVGFCLLVFMVCNIFGPISILAVDESVLDSRPAEMPENRTLSDNSGRWPVEGNTTTKTQWATTKLPAAWNIRTSSGVKVAVLDHTVLGTHEDLVHNYRGGTDFISANYTINHVDAENHGTEVAGVIGATADNIFNTAAGVCWDVDLYSYHTIYTEHSNAMQSYQELINATDVCNAIQYAEYHDVKILNLSFIMNYSEDVYNMIRDFSGLVICSAGNNNVDLDEEIHPQYPAIYNCSNIISVGALNSNCTGKSDFSNYGATSVDLFAPGESIFTTENDGSYCVADGTTFSAPYVAGVAALIWGAKPNLTAAQVKAAIMNNTDQLSALNGKCVSGGRINAFKALKSVMTEREARTLIGDVDNDGYDDMVVTGNCNGKLRLTTFLGDANGTFSQAYTTYTEKTFARSDPLFIGDANGDGCDDVLLHWVSSGIRQLMIFTSDRDGYFKLNSDGIANNRNTGQIYDTTNHPSQSFFKDVTGDGKADFVCCMKDDNGKRSFYVYQGKTTNAGNAYMGTAITTSSVRTYIETDPMYSEDVSGDGRNDFIVHWATDNKRQLLVYTAKSDGTFYEGVNYSTTNTHNLTTYPCKLMMGDCNNDGKSDFIVMWKNSAVKRNLLVYKGTVSSGKGTFTAGVSSSSVRSYIDSDPVYVGDFTGDGKDDVLVEWTLSTNGCRQLLNYCAGSNGAYSEGVDTATTNINNDSVYPSTRVVLKKGADAMDDFAVRYTGNDRIMSIKTYTGKTNGTFNAGVDTVMDLFPYFIYT